jgi:hypothetical protein
MKHAKKKYPLVGGGVQGFRGYRKLLIFENGSDTFSYRGQFFFLGNQLFSTIT